MDAEVCSLLTKFLSQKTNLAKYKEGVLRFIFGNHQGRNSESSTIMPIWVDGDFKPVKIRLIDGKTELLLGMDVIRKLQLTVDFGSERFQVGQGEWEAMTFNDKHHWVFPLVPNARAYKKLEQYFRKNASPRA